MFLANPKQYEGHNKQSKAANNLQLKDRSTNHKPRLVFGIHWAILPQPHFKIITPKTSFFLMTALNKGNQRHISSRFIIRLFINIKLKFTLLATRSRYTARVENWPTSVIGLLKSTLTGGNKINRCPILLSNQTSQSHRLPGSAR